MSPNSLKAVKVFFTLLIAESALKKGNFREAADLMLSAKVLLISMLSIDEIRTLSKWIEEFKQTQSHFNTTLRR